MQNMSINFNKFVNKTIVLSLEQRTSNIVKCSKCALKGYDMHLQTCKMKQKINNETYQLYLCFFNFNSSLRNILKKKFMPNLCQILQVRHITIRLRY